MTNAAAASSSSTSLVGSGTAASNLKTLTIALDDDDVIEGLLSGWLPPGNVGGDVIPIDGYCYKAPDDCVIPPGLTQPNCACAFEDPKACYCSTGQPGAYCGESSNCVIPPGSEQPYCYKEKRMVYATCQSGQPGAYCGETSDCVIPPGLDHPVCRSDGPYSTCQSGQAGSLCGVTDDCVVPPGLEHAVCRKDRCQQGKKGNYCGSNSDCLSRFCRPIGKCG